MHRQTHKPQPLAAVLFGLAALGSSVAASADAGFTHPGVLMSQQQLDYVRTQIQNKAEPFASAFAAAQSSSEASLTYKLEGPPSSHIIDCGSYSNPDIGCSAEDHDASAAYLQALLWYFTGNKTYAENSIRIMNTYAHNLRGHTNSNGPLQSAWTAEKWPAAAEIIRYTYKGWQPADVTAFGQMLKTQYLPNIDATQGAGKNGNWQLSMIDGMMGIAVFTEDRSVFNSAVAQWKQWVPAYFYDHALDGNAPVTFKGAPSDWNGQTVFNTSTSGVAQETCRDLAHTQLGLSATTNAAETAYIQGTDLFAAEQPRLTTALEYHARLLLGVRNTDQTKSYPVPAGFPGLCNGQYIPVLEDTMEVAYNAYHNRLGVALPETWKHLTQDVRPAAQPTNLHNVLWETLTHGGS